MKLIRFRSSAALILLLFLPVSSFSEEPCEVIQFPIPSHTTIPSDTLRDANRFIGTYVFDEESGGGTSTVLIDESGRMIMWYGAGSCPVSSFEIDLHQVGTTETSRNTYELMPPLEEQAYELNENVAREIQVTTGKLTKRVKIVELIIDGDDLIFSYRKSFYRRQFRLFGRWVLDKTSFNAKNNAFRIKRRLTRLSSSPLTFREFSLSIRNNQNYVVTTKETTGDQIRRAGQVDFEQTEQQDHLELLNYPLPQVTEPVRDETPPSDSAQLFDLSEIRKKRMGGTCEDNLNQ